MKTQPSRSPPRRPEGRAGSGHGVDGRGRGRGRGLSERVLARRRHGRVCWCLSCLRYGGLPLPLELPLRRLGFRPWHHHLLGWPRPATSAGAAHQQRLLVVMVLVSGLVLVAVMLWLLLLLHLLLLLLLFLLELLALQLLGVRGGQRQRGEVEERGRGLGEGQLLGQDQRGGAARRRRRHSSELGLSCWPSRSRRRVSCRCDTSSSSTSSSCRRCGILCHRSTPRRRRGGGSGVEARDLPGARKACTATCSGRRDRGPGRCLPCLLPTAIWPAEEALVAVGAFLGSKDDGRDRGAGEARLRGGRRGAHRERGEHGDGSGEGGAQARWWR